MFDASTYRTRFLYNTLEELHSSPIGARQNSSGDSSFLQPLYSINEEDNVVDDVEEDSEDGEDLHSEDTR